MYVSISIGGNPMFLEKVYAQQVTLQITPSDQVRITNLGTLISALIGTLLIIAALLAFFFLIFGGIQWITSGGDKTGMEAARNKITHAIVGLVIVGAAWAIMMLVQGFLGLNVIGGSGITLPQAW